MERDDLSTCGRCGYAVTGLTTFTCPECGSDLREVGIVRGDRGARRPDAVGTFVRVVGWKLALFAAAFSIAAFFLIDHYVYHVRPTTWVDEHVVRARPRSGAYKDLKVSLIEHYTTRGISRPPGTPATGRSVEVEMSIGDQRYNFTRDIFAGTNTYRDAKGVEQVTRGPVAQELTAWMSAHGIDVTNSTVRGEIDALANAITQSNQIGAFAEQMGPPAAAAYFDSGSATGSSQPVGVGHPHTMPVLAAVITGFAGLTAIWFVNRARLARELLGVSTQVRPQRGADGATGVRTLSVMFSDVKDYTARTARESRLGILDVVRRHRELAEPVVKRHGGEIVKSLGDGLLMTFDNATDAVLAGLEIQGAVAARGDDLELRIAISTGEVATQRGDVFGEAVNLASRAQQHAKAGEVLLTEATFAMINRREVGADEAGVFELKGLNRPVRLYRAVGVTA